MKIFFTVLKYVFFLSVGVALFWYVARGVDINEIVEKFKNARFGYIIIAMAIAILGHISRGIRWTLLMKPLGYKVSYSRAFMAVLIGYAANYALPRIGEISRCAVLKKSNDLSLSRLLGTVIVERITDFLSLFVLLIIVFILEFSKLKDLAWNILQKAKVSGNLFIYIIIVIVVLFVFAALLYIFRATIKRSKYYLKIREIIAGFFEGIKTIKQMENKWAYLFHTIFIWTTYWLMAYLVFFSLDSTANLSLLTALMILVLGGIAFVLPVQGGIGTFHFAMVMGLSLYSIQRNDALLYAFVSHTSQMFLLLGAGAISYILFLNIMRKNRNAKNNNHKE